MEKWIFCVCRFLGFFSLFSLPWGNLEVVKKEEMTKAVKLKDFFLRITFVFDNFFLFSFCFGVFVFLLFFFFLS